MTIQVNPLNGTVSADFDHVHEVCGTLLNSVRKESIGYAKLGCALALARLENSAIPMTPAAESAFVSACMEWVDTYFAFLCAPTKEGDLPN